MLAEHARPRLHLRAKGSSCAALTCSAGGTVQQLQLQASIPGSMWFVMCAAVSSGIVAANGAAA